ncbi:hypothetical protein [Psychrobacter pygoscelis]|uniref:hypothetical protein n=1 Tax=Psychrobacter pygoscelis TaxID=2488563 RepID=UPI00103BCB5B|nr:hypothetical protein [Psychrobacter pygoscelis]
MSYFADKQQRINDFLRRANQVLPEDNPLYFSGHYITGQTKNPDILFIGINPGHRQWHNLPARKANTRLVPYQSQPCKYIEELQLGNRFAKRVLDIACGGDLSKLEHCAETSLLSYFASPTESVVKAQIKKLPKDMQAEHRELTHLDFAAINPKHIVCIGWRTFDEFIKRYHPKLDSRTEITSKQLPIAINGTGKDVKMMDYYARTEIDGIPVHGVRHFSTPLSRAMLDDMKAIFRGVWEEMKTN